MITLPNIGLMLGDVTGIGPETLAGKLDGICFAPLYKGAMHQGGWKFPDEHQMFAALTGHTRFFGDEQIRINNEEEP
jgi:4-hydroxy-L-threonine phosphate dehydrogenase PdxA